MIMLLAGNPFPREHLWTQLRHPQWHGLSFADLFFPLFLFAVGGAMTLSKRTGSAHLVLRRTLILIVLGVALTSLKHQHFGVFGVLQHIAIAYLLAWLVLQAPRRFQWVLTGGILVATLLAFVTYASPGADPWGEGDSAAHAASRAVTGGFSTEGILQSATSAVNVLAGAFLARFMKDRPTKDLFLWILGHASWLLAAGLLLSPLVPINKKIWTPSFALVTIGTSCLWLALFAWLSDVKGWRLSKPLEQLGANPIAVYVVFMTATELLRRLRGWWPELAILGNPTLGTFVYGVIWVVLAWLFARWLHDRNLYIKV